MWVRRRWGAERDEAGLGEGADRARVAAFGIDGHARQRSGDGYVLGEQPQGGRADPAAACRRLQEDRSRVAAELSPGLQVADRDIVFEDDVRPDGLTGFDANRAVRADPGRDGGAAQ